MSFMINTKKLRTNQPIFHTHPVSGTVTQLSFLSCTKKYIDVMEPGNYDVVCVPVSECSTTLAAAEVHNQGFLSRLKDSQYQGKK